MRVSILFASKHGSSREIAQAISDELRAAGIEAVCTEANGAAPGPADAFVVGSAVYTGKWLSGARSILERERSALATHPTWLFSVGPLGDPPRPEMEAPEGIYEAAEAISARDHKVFAGKLDPSGLGWLERMMVRAIKAPEGDFRDWDEIRSWARSIATELGFRPEIGGEYVLRRHDPALRLPR